jgi:hypothetical protein
VRRRFARDPDEALISTACRRSRVDRHPAYNEERRLAATVKTVTGFRREQPWQSASRRAVDARSQSASPAWLSHTTLGSRQTGGLDPESAAATIHSNAPKQGLGDRHLHSDVAGLALLGRRHGSVLAHDRRVAAWRTTHRELVLNAVLMAVRRRPRGTLIHPDQGTQTAAMRGGDSAARITSSRV